jgi:hypothetical protein
MTTGVEMRVINADFEGHVGRLWQDASFGWRLDVLWIGKYGRDRAYELAGMSWDDLSMIDRVSVVESVWMAKSVVDGCGILSTDKQ